jgi:hypothetical protein
VKAIARDVQTWSLFSDQKGYAFNGYAVSTEERTVLIDPPDRARTAGSPSTCSSRSPACGSPTATTAAPRRPFATATA